MQTNQKQKKKQPNGFLIFIIIVSLVSFLNDSSIPAVSVFAILFFAAIVLLSVAAAKGVKKKNVRTDDSHDRIDHTRDYRIDSKTGKIANLQAPRQIHSSQEHWKEQLDNLLANGTIDKEEYYTMLRQHSN